MRRNETLAFHLATILQKSSNINIENDYESE